MPAYALRLVPVATRICSLISACLHSLYVATATNAVVVDIVITHLPIVMQYSFCKLSNIYEHLNDGMMWCAICLCLRWRKWRGKNGHRDRHVCWCNLWASLSCLTYVMHLKAGISTDKTHFNTRRETTANASAMMLNVSAKKKKIFFQFQLWDIVVGAMYLCDTARAAGATVKQRQWYQLYDITVAKCQRHACPQYDMLKQDTSSKNANTCDSNVFFIIRLWCIINPFVWDTVVTFLAEKSHFVTIMHAHNTMYTQHSSTICNVCNDVRYALMVNPRRMAG